jgi:hypothetical protein
VERAARRVRHVVCARDAPAQGTEPRSSYDVAPGCATRSAWQKALKARLPPLLRTHPLLETLSVHVTEIDAKRGGAYLGKLTTDGEPLADGARTVRGETCAEVLDALSFIGALGLERATATTARVSSQLLLSEVRVARVQLGHRLGQPVPTTADLQGLRY